MRPALLRAERICVQLSTRDVERLSRKIADEKKSQDYYISHGWLTDAENGAYAPGPSNCTPSASATSGDTRRSWASSVSTWLTSTSGASRCC